MNLDELDMALNASAGIGTDPDAAAPDTDAATYHNGGTLVRVEPAGSGHRASFVDGWGHLHSAYGPTADKAVALLLDRLLEAP